MTATSEYVSVSGQSPPPLHLLLARVLTPKGAVPCLLFVCQTLSEGESEDEKEEEETRHKFPWFSLFMLILSLAGYNILSRHNVSFGPLVPAVNAVAVLGMFVMTCRSLGSEAGDDKK